MPGCVESTVESHWKDFDFSVGSCTSVCLVLYSTGCQACFLLVAAFRLSFLKQSHFRSVCFLELWGNWEFPLRGCKINLVLNRDKSSLPPPPLTEFFRKKNVLHFLWRGRQERLELLHGESDRFQRCNGGSELPAGQQSANIDAVKQVHEDVSSVSLSVLHEQSVELHFFLCANK